MLQAVRGSIAQKKGHLMEEVIAAFPYAARVDGSCEKLDLETGKCGVY